MLVGKCCRYASLRGYNLDKHHSMFLLLSLGVFRIGRSRIDFISVLSILLFWTLMKIDFTSAQEGGGDAPRVEVTAPINPVREDAMILIHCQIWNKVEGLEVTMSRRVKGASSSQRLSWDDKVQDDDEDRIFLAERRLADGSVVYFLSIIEVTMADEGTYSCKIVSNADDTITQVASASVDLKIQYFPEENPICDMESPQELIVKSGTEITVKCTSGVAFPIVDLEWSRTASTFSDEGKQTIENNQITSTLKKTLYLRDQQAMFLCKLTSVAFPNKLKTCHIGPFTITENPEVREPEVEKTKPPNMLHTFGIVTIEPTWRRESEPTVSMVNLEDCEYFCTPFSGPVLYWMIGTIVAVFLAVLFVIVGLLFAMKICRLQSISKRNAALRPAQRHVSEDLYERLECRPDGNPTVYMSLDRLKKPNLLVVKERDIDRDYTGTPIAPVFH